MRQFVVARPLVGDLQRRDSRMAPLIVAVALVVEVKIVAADQPSTSRQVAENRESF